MIKKINMTIEQLFVAIVVGSMIGIPTGIGLILWNEFTGKYDKLIEKEWEKKRFPKDKND